MTEFHTEIQRRASDAQRSLAEARAAEDDYLARIRLGEIQDLARIAAEHGLVLDGVEESLAAHGLPTPAPGIALSPTIHP
jgi:hypothetical protein